MLTHSFRHHLAVLSAAALCTAATSVCAATINVTSTADSGNGSLRNALAGAANGDTINATGISGTVLLTSGELLVNKSVSIVGPGPGSLAVNGNGASRVFHITPSNSVTLSGLSITNGSAPGNVGGGIYNEARGNSATLTVTNCVLSGNSAGNGGGIFHEGLPGIPTMTLANCTISGNVATFRGGGIFNSDATMTVSNCTVSGNMTVGSGGGGGVYSGGFGTTLSVVNSTFSSNSSSNAGGGILNDGSNSGTATLTVINSTFSGNFTIGAGGAILNLGSVSGSATLTVRNCTLSGNVATSFGSSINNNGGFGGSASLNIVSTILKPGSGQNLSVSDATVNSLGYNLCSDNGEGALTGPGDRINTDPLLGPLQNNGGTTLTHMPLVGSPAMDKGKNVSGTTVDQRGFARTVDLCVANASGGDGTDIGAIELPVPSFAVLNRNDSGAGSLREAIFGANLCPDADTILFDASAYGTITLSSGELLITSPISIVGPGATSVIIAGNGSNRVFHIAGSNNVTIAGVTIANGAAGADGGGGIYNERSILTVSNCVFTGNSAQSGGGIYSDGENGIAALFVTASTFNGNSATSQGGGIYHDGITGSATLAVLNSTFSTNSAQNGAGIYNAGIFGTATLSVSACTFSGNTASLGGGGIVNEALLSSEEATLEIGDTIVNAGNSGLNLININGTVTSRGYNLCSDNGGGFLTAAGDQINTNALLGSLQNNGGPTLTHALLPGSPALDKGKRNAVPTLVSNTDQRGLPRPLDLPSIANAAGGDGSDIGAFEAQGLAVAIPMLLVGPQKLPNGPFQFFFSNTPGASFTVYASTNIALPFNSWTVLGPPTETSPGNFQFADPGATNRPRRFYRVGSP